MQKTLVRAEKKLFWLENSLEELEFAKVALEQQDQAINTLEERLIEAQKTGGKSLADDEGSREIGGILAGVVDAVDDTIETIDRENPNKKDKDKIIFGKLDGLKAQANKFKKLAEKSKDTKKVSTKHMKKLQKFRQIELD